MEEAVLLLHVVAQVYAAITLLFGHLLYDAPAEKLESARSIGNGALCVALVGFALLLQQPHRRHGLYFGVIAQYHAGVTFLNLRHPLMDMPWWAAPGFHGVLFLWFAARAFRRTRT